MKQLIKQYQEQLNNVKGQIKEMEQSGASKVECRRYTQLKQIKNELQTSISQMKRYVKKG